MSEKFYVALTENNGYHWTVFLSEPELASADASGFIAVGESFDTQEEDEEAAKLLNYVMFNREE